MRTIFLRPDWNDQATRAGTYWTKLLEDKCPTELLDLYAALAVRASSDAAIKETPDAFYYGFGHGNSSLFTGQNQATIIDASNVALWNKSWIHLLSCSVFAGLGLKFPHGSGYNRTFYFYLSGTTDGYAEPYFDSDHQVQVERWKGKTMAEQIKTAKDKFTWWYSQPPPAGKDYLPWDRDSLIGTGDPNDSPTPPSGIKDVYAMYQLEGGQWQDIGAMMKGEDDLWSISWKVPMEGRFKLEYRATDYEDNVKIVETGWFNVKYPESPIRIVPVYPKGGEEIVAKTLKLQVQVSYIE